MRIVVVGGGPAGLYFGLLMKKADPGHEVTILERNAPDATFGWGVVFSEETLGAFRDADPESHAAIADSFTKWNAIDIRFRGQTIRSRGHAFSGLARTELLAILQRRCAELGVEMRFLTEVADPTWVREAYPDADLIVAADGVNGRFREAHAQALKPRYHTHSTRFVWFGTDLVFTAFTFIFRETPWGTFQVHGYPFDANLSTFIVECPEETWRAAGLEGATEEESIAFCQDLFSEDLRGHRLLSNRSLWISFVTLRCESWHDGDVVLLGDAAHTAHFTIGSGTKLAMEDAVALAQAFERHKTDRDRALTEYEMERQPLVERFQQAASESAAYFENVVRYAAFEPLQFAFNLLTRSGRISHANLAMRDPEFARRVDAWYATGAAETPRLLASPPAFAPLRAGRLRAANRIAWAAGGEDDALDGLPGEGSRRGLLDAAAGGAGLIVTELVAVSPDGRITPGTPGMYRRAHQAAWKALVGDVHRAGEASVAIRLGHAGRRGATRPRRFGVDLPLSGRGWKLAAPSAIPYSARSRVPVELDRDEMVKLLHRFERSAVAAARAGFDALLLDLSAGYLLGSFLSPLSNHRTDAYGGSLQDRMRFPLEVFDAVRAVWPEDRPAGVRLLVDDWAPGGFGPDDAVAVAGALRDRGCDLVQPAAGWTVPPARPEYGRGYLVPAADRLRNEAGLATLVGGNVTTLDEANTILAAGRADAVVADFEHYTYSPR